MNSPRVPKRVLRVVMINTTLPQMTREFTGELVEAPRRLVSIELTPEQCEALGARWTGTSGRDEQYEDIASSWLEEVES